MPTTSERRALVLLSVVATLGVAARIGRATSLHIAPTPAERHALDVQIARVESVRATQAGGARTRRAEPQRASLSRADSATHVAKAQVMRTPRLRADGPRGQTARVPTEKRDAPHTPVDIDVASASDIEGLPLIGPSLAARIIANRDSCGAFGSLRELQRVRGIGETLTKRIAALVTFSSRSRPTDDARPRQCARAEKRAALRRRGRP